MNGDFHPDCDRRGFHLAQLPVEWSLRTTKDPSQKKERCMRSDLIFGALTHVNNRYQLCQLASKATRKLHKPNTRLQDTTNEVLDRFKDSMPMNEILTAEPEETLATVRRAA